jgi:hypothetical protein
MTAASGKTVYSGTSAPGACAILILGGYFSGALGRGNPNCSARFAAIWR